MSETSSADHQRTPRTPKMHRGGMQRFVPKRVSFFSVAMQPNFPFSAFARADCTYQHRLYRSERRRGRCMLPLSDGRTAVEGCSRATSATFSLSGVLTPRPYLDEPSASAASSNSCNIRRFREEWGSEYTVNRSSRSRIQNSMCQSDFLIHLLVYMGSSDTDARTSNTKGRGNQVIN